MDIASLTGRLVLFPATLEEPLRRRQKGGASHAQRVCYDVRSHVMAECPESPANSTLELLVKARAGDEDALNGLLQRYIPRLQRWASGRLPSSARHLLDTSDVVQDAVIAALRRLDSFEIRHDGALHAYLRQSVNNRLTDLFRESQRRPAYSALPEDLASSEASPVEMAIGAEALQRYESALARLSEQDRQLVILRVEFGHDYPEIAEAIGKPTRGAARIAVGRALAKLATEMGHG